MFLEAVACTSEPVKLLPYPKSMQGIRYLLGYDEVDETVVQEGRKEEKKERRKLVRVGALLL